MLGSRHSSYYPFRVSETSSLSSTEDRGTFHGTTLASGHKITLLPNLSGSVDCSRIIFILQLISGYFHL